jgi:hypothetical protein
MLVIGGLATLPTTITGLIDHLAYEDSSLPDIIETHQLLVFATTASSSAY